MHMLVLSIPARTKTVLCSRQDASLPHSLETHGLANARFAHCLPPRGNKYFPDPLLVQFLPVKQKPALRRTRVLPAGIEPASPPSEGGILSIERRERTRRSVEMLTFPHSSSELSKCDGVALRERTREHILSWSGCRESNPDCMTPSHAYYHYTTARFREIFGRGAGNRTRSLRTRSARTTGILRPESRKRISHVCVFFPRRGGESFRLRPDQKSHAAKCGWTLGDSNS